MVFAASQTQQSHFFATKQYFFQACLYRITPSYLLLQYFLQFGKSIRYAGYGYGYDDVVYDGSVADGKFVAYYCKGDIVVAVATLMRDPIAAHFANHLRSGKTLLKENVTTEWYKAD